jgi:TolA-binding protein
MASVEELILAAKSKQKQSPLSALAELIKVGASGYAEGQKQRQTADLSRVEIARKMIELQQIQEDMKAQEENRKFFKDQMDAESELRVRNNLASTAGTPAATTPRNKVQKEFSLDSKGRLSGAVKIVPTPTPTSLDELVTEKVRNGELSIEDAYRMKQPGAMGGGKPPTGFRWTPDGNLEIIPGGPANIKAEAERASYPMRPHW